MSGAQVPQFDRCKMQPATRENASKEQKEISFTCRLVQKEDLAALACLEALCFAGERWNERMLAEMLENPCANMFVLCAEYNGLTEDTISADRTDQREQSNRIDAGKKENRASVTNETVRTNISNGTSAQLACAALPVVGWGGMWCVADEAEIASVCVDPAYRRLGGGTKLLQTLLRQARLSGAQNVYLEVRASNQAAQELYRCAGFECIGVRKRYYTNPLEDAVLMRCAIMRQPSVDETETNQ